MILEESIAIAAPPERVADFLESLDRRYREWHPDHDAFRWLPGADGDRDRFWFEERIGGRRLRLAMRVTRSADGREAVCRPLSAAARWVFPWMSFGVAPEGSGSRYTHRIALRLGPLAPLLERSLLAPLRRHMKEETEALARHVGASAGD